MPERREHERFELLAHVELTRGGAVETLATINISAGGLLLRNDRHVAFEIGEIIRVHFDVPELAPAFTIDATIVRVIAPTARPPALAAMWRSSDANASAALGQMLWALKQS